MRTPFLSLLFAIGLAAPSLAGDASLLNGAINGSSSPSVAQSHSGGAQPSWGSAGSRSGGFAARRDQLRSEYRTRDARRFYGAYEAPVVQAQAVSCSAAAARIARSMRARVLMARPVSASQCEVTLLVPQKGGPSRRETHRVPA